VLQAVLFANKPAIHIAAIAGFSSSAKFFKKQWLAAEQFSQHLS